MLDAFRSLRARGLGVIDVGARDGILPIFGEAAPLLEVVGFEPDPDEAQRLQTEAKRPSTFQSLTYLPYALGDTDTQRVLHLCRSRGSSSFYQPNRKFLDRFPEADRFDIVSTVAVPVRSLDGLVSDRTTALPRFIDFIKMDTQGSELEILRGAQQVLRSQVVAVQVEVEFTPLYREQAVFRDVDAFLSDCGLTLFKLRRQEFIRSNYARQPHLSAGQLVFGDALYLRDPLDGQPPWGADEAHRLEALILIAMLYDLHDFALEVISAPPFAKVLDVERLRQCVLQRSRKLHSFTERLRAARAMLSLGEWGHRYPQRWARGDDNFYSAIS